MAILSYDCIMVVQNFTKMHGLGNDFVVLDARFEPLLADLEQMPVFCQKLADRRKGIGCDQVIILRSSSDADVFMDIYNADGSCVSACGNATRCVGWLLMQQMQRETVTIETQADILVCRNSSHGVEVSMGNPVLDWESIPMSEYTDILSVPLNAQLPHGVCVSMGNPHVILFVDDIKAISLQEQIALLEYHPLFPEKVNITVAQCVGRECIAMKTWERGAGATLACGTAACATIVAARLKGLSESQVMMQMPGGALAMQWEGSVGDVHHDVIMRGGVQRVFTGQIDAEWLAL